MSLINHGNPKQDDKAVGDTNRRLLDITHELRERVKELDCLYSISRLVEQNVDLHQILQTVVDIVPDSWQYPEITCARIKLKDREFKTRTYRKTAWQQIEKINVNGELFGTITVGYLLQKPAADEGPFLSEERKLLHAIAERLGHIVEHMFADKNLQSLYKRERELRKQLQTEMMARVDLTRKLVHELKTPLTALVATSQLLQDEAGDTRLGKLALLVHQGANNINNRINDLQDVVKSEVGKLKLEIRPVDLPALILSILEEIAAFAQQAEVTINLEIDGKIPTVTADPARVRQILLNLLNNALKYAAGGKKIIVKVVKKPDAVLAEVRDFGNGISPREKRNLFKQGYRITQKHSGSGGLGIGLALCKILVELQCGEIWVKSQVGKGTSFFFTLPISKPIKGDVGKVR